MSAPVTDLGRTRYLPCFTGGAAAPFDPTDIAGLSLYLKPDAGVQSDGAAQFTLANKEYLEITDSFDFHDGDWTVGGWVYLDSTATDQVFFGQYDSSNIGFIAYYHNTLGFQGDASTDGSATTTVASGLTASTGKWYFVLLKHDDGTDLEIKVRAEDAGSWTTVAEAFTGGIYNSTENVRMGAMHSSGAGAFHLDGRCDSWFVVKDLTTDTEDDALFDSGTGVTGEEVEAATSGGLSTFRTKLSTTGEWWDLGEAAGEQRLGYFNGFHLTAVGDELVTNGTFASDANFTKGTGWSIAAGVADSDGSQSSDSDLSQTSVTTSGDVYTVGFTTANRTTGNLTPVLGTQEGTDRAGNDTYTEEITANGTTVALRADADWDGDADDFTIKIANPVKRADGIAAGSATDVNLATSFDGSTQYLNLSAKNLLTADESIAYAATSSWSITGGVTSITRVVIADEGISTSGLPLGVKTAYKVVCSGSGQLNIECPITITASIHQFSAYVLSGAWSGGTIRCVGNGFDGSSGSVTAPTPNSSTWQRASRSRTPSVDVVGGIRLTDHAATAVADDVLYFACAEVAQEASLTAWDPNALFSFGDQKCLIAAWAYRGIGQSGDDRIFDRRVGATSEYDIRIDDGVFDATIVDSVGAHQLTGGTIPEGSWGHVALTYDPDDTGQEAQLWVNGVSVDSESPDSLVQAVLSTTIGAQSGGGDKFLGRIDSIVACSEAAGMTDSFTTIIPALFNNGHGIKPSEITTANKSTYGLVDGWDMEDDFVSTENSITPTNNGSLTAGDSEGVDYIAGLVSVWQDQSGNANDFEQTDIDKRPQFHSNIFGTKGGIKFDGVDDLMEISSAFLTGSKGHVFVLLKLNTAGNQMDTFLSSSDEASTALYTLDFDAHTDDSRSNVQRIQQRNNDTHDRIAGTNTTVASTDYIMMFSSSGTAYTIRLNGAEETLSVDGGADTGDWFGDTPNRDNVIIGGRKYNSVDNFFDGYISYILVYDGVDLTAANISDLESWLDDQVGNTIL